MGILNDSSSSVRGGACGGGAEAPNPQLAKRKSTLTAPNCEVVMSTDVLEIS